MNRPNLRIFAILLAGVMALAACGDDDSDAADGPSPTGDAASNVAAYCDAALAIETVPDPDLDEDASPETIAATLADYRDQLRPLADQILAVAPDEIADDLDVLSAALDQLGETEGDPFEDPEVAAAQQRTHAFDLDHCGWTHVPVTATEYAFDGINSELPAGPASFELTNDGAELHMLTLVRINDDVTEPVENLLALPDEEAFQLVTPVPGEAFAPPDGSDYLVADLDPGRYLAACFIPVGTDGPPHAAEGMYAEFTVT